jgi:type VI secretion system VgrG family protein
MATNTQVPASEPFALSLPQREEAFTVTSFTGHEAVGELYRVLVHVMVDEGDDALSTALLGQPASLLLQNDGTTVRAIHGLVARVQSHGVMLGGRRAYSLTIVPSFWKLKRRRTRRIFQAMTTLDIANQVLGEWNVPSRLAVQRELTRRAYTVQYDETDFAFRIRLFAEDGLLYFFEHLVLPPDGTGETLVLADAPGDFSPIEGDATLHFHRDPGSQIREDMVTWFAKQTSVRSSHAMVRGYDFQRPDVPLGDDAASADATDGIDVIYEHEGSYEEDLGARPAQARLDQEHAKAQRVFGASFCRRLVPGTTFDLIEHEDTNLDRDFVVTQIEHEGYAPGTAPPGRVVYQNRFRCAPADVSIRPAHRPLKPNQVAESAVVVGPADQEIYTDEFGRVKVQFPWDLEGQNDERSSCWLRVVQAWAGAGWGAQFIPRVGIVIIVTLASTQSTRRRSWAHSILRPPGFTTPSPRLGRGRLRTAFSLSRPRSGNVPSLLATNGDASSGFFAVRFGFFFLARGNVAVAPALAAARGTTAARSGERGPKRAVARSGLRYGARCQGVAGSERLQRPYSRGFAPCPTPARFRRPTCASFLPCGPSAGASWAPRWMRTRWSRIPSFACGSPDPTPPPTPTRAPCWRGSTARARAWRLTCSAGTAATPRSTMKTRKATPRSGRS